MFDMTNTSDPAQMTPGAATPIVPPVKQAKPDDPADTDLFRKMIAMGYLPG